MRAIGRDRIIARARNWVDAPRRYSQDDCDPASGYRLDCSGYVSMAWHLDAPGLTTVELPQLCDQIESTELRPGDVVMVGGPGTGGNAGHVIIFSAWADVGPSRFWAFEQVPSGTVHHLRAFPPSPPYLSYRYRAIAE
jgi:hypothetical protein